MNPFEVDKLRVETNLKAKTLFEEKVSARKVEKDYILSKARARCVNLRREQKEAEAVKASIAEEQAALTDNVDNEEEDKSVMKLDVDTQVEESKSVMFALSPNSENDEVEIMPPNEDVVAELPADVPLSPSQRLSQKRELSQSSPSLPAYESPYVPPTQTNIKPSRRPTISNECRGLLWKQVCFSFIFDF